jgi:DNA-directed RNA polymerase beta' subunit
MTSKLSLLPDSLVEKIATFDITESLDLYDPRFGNAGNSDVLCPTCNMRNDICMGHHALLSLGVHIFHPLTYKESQRIINSKCLCCKTPLLKVSKSRARRCHICNTVNHGDYVIQATDMKMATRQNEPEHAIYANSIQNGILPDGFVISKVLVPPIHLRTPEDMEWPTEMQRLYEQLTAAVRSGKNVCGAYSKILGVHKKEGITGIMSGKNGVFRQLMMGKRVELSARAVIVGDPCLKLDQVAIPKAIADSVRVKAPCTKYNIVDLKNTASNRLLWWAGTNDVVNPSNILEGMAFERALKDGDLTMLNRQPSLSRVSLMCFKVVIRRDEEMVFAINPQVTPPFNADFDGDEMNTFFMSNRAEMVELCSFSECTDKLTPVQDVITGCYLMSAGDISVKENVWNDCVMYAACALRVQTLSPAFALEAKVQTERESLQYEANTKGNKTTFGLLSMCIPDYDGRRLYKKSFKDFKIVNTYVLQLVVNRWLSVYGLTVSLKSIVVAPVIRTENETTDAFKERCIEKVRQDMSGTGLMSMIDSGAKGSVVHASHMAVAIGLQYIGGREGMFCQRPYSRGLTQDEFFGHQMAAREGVVSTGIGTASTGYLNRRACKTIADLKLQYNGTVADEDFVSSFLLP